MPEKSHWPCCLLRDCNVKNELLNFAAPAPGGVVAEAADAAQRLQAAQSALSSALEDEQRLKAALQGHRKAADGCA